MLLLLHRVFIRRAPLTSSEWNPIYVGNLTDVVPAGSRWSIAPSHIRLTRKRQPAGTTSVISQIWTRLHSSAQSPAPGLGRRNVYLTRTLPEASSEPYHAAYNPGVSELDPATACLKRPNFCPSD